MMHTIVAAQRSRILGPVGWVNLVGGWPWLLIS
jgi:hypothetical protein